MIIHLDRNGTFIRQWYGNEVGQGKFSSAHGLAVDPRNGDVWIATARNTVSSSTRATGSS
jgi:DNA-binding beta-propeller fold protein YncE